MDGWMDEEDLERFWPLLTFTFFDLTFSNFTNDSFFQSCVKTESMAPPARNIMTYSYSVGF